MQQLQVDVAGNAVERAADFGQVEHRGKEVQRVESLDGSKKPQLRSCVLGVRAHQVIGNRVQRCQVCVQFRMGSGEFDRDRYARDALELRNARVEGFIHAPSRQRDLHMRFHIGIPSRRLERACWRSTARS